MYGNFKSYRIRTIESNRKILQRKTKLIRKWFLYCTFGNQNFLAKFYRFIYRSFLFVLFFVCKENRSRLNTNINAPMFCLRHNQPQPANLLFKISVPSARFSLGHFRVPETLTFKMRPLSLENEFYLHEDENHFHIKHWPLTLTSFWYRGPGELGNGQLQPMIIIWKG